MPYKDLFFAVLDAEIFLWDEVESALCESGCGLTAPRFIPLSFLAERPMHVRELAECLHAKECAVSRLTERMTKDGLLIKIPDENDKRAVMLHITDKGRIAERAARSAFETALAKAFAGLRHEEIESLIALLACMKPETSMGA